MTVSKGAACTAAAADGCGDEGDCAAGSTDTVVDTVWLNSSGVGNGAGAEGRVAVGGARRGSLRYGAEDVRRTRAGGPAGASPGRACLPGGGGRRRPIRGVDQRASA